MVGRKESTAPTPEKMPSIISECIGGAISSTVSVLSTEAVTASITLLRMSLRKAPITSNVSQNTMPMISTKIGIA